MEALLENLPPRIRRVSLKHDPGKNDNKLNAVVARLFKRGVTVYSQDGDILYFQSIHRKKLFLSCKYVAKCGLSGVGLYLIISRMIDRLQGGV